MAKSFDKDSILFALGIVSEKMNKLEKGMADKYELRRKVAQSNEGLFLQSVASIDIDEAMEREHLQTERLLIELLKTVLGRIPN